MKMVIAFLLVALCCSLGTGYSAGRRRRQVQSVNYVYYKGGFQGSVEEQKMYSKDQAQMFGFMYQSMICLYTAVRNGPANKKAESYKFITINLVRYVETTAASCGMSTQQLFLNQKDYNIYMELVKMVQSGDFRNIARVERTCDGFFSVLGSALGGVFHALGFTAGEIGLCAAGLLGAIGGLSGDLLGGILNGLGGLVGGVELLGTGLVGGLAQLLGGVAGGLGNALTGLVKGIANVGGGATGGHSGGFMGY
ncbi:uncharacterized protein LOC144768842 [Lissotriton helveticus]